MLDYLHSLLRQKFSYSVINTTKSMLTQTLPFFGIKTSEFRFLERMMKGCYNSNPPKVRYTYTWDVSIVLDFLCTLYPLEDLSLKLLTLKLVSLVALTTAGRTQTLSALDIRFMKVIQTQNIVVFHINELLKTSRPGVSLPAITLKAFDKPELCVVKTLLFYIERTKGVRKASRLFVSFATFNAVTTSTLARWLKTVLDLSGIDNNLFKAHSFRGASVSKAFASGCTLKDILSTANWSSARTFYKFYHKDVSSNSNSDFSSSVLSV